MRVICLLLLLTTLSMAGDSLRICDADFSPGMTREQVIATFRLPPMEQSDRAAFLKQMAGGDTIMLIPQFFGLGDGETCFGTLFLDERGRVTEVLKALPGTISALAFARSLISEARNAGISEEPQLITVRRVRTTVAPQPALDTPGLAREILELRVGHKAIQISLEEVGNRKGATIYTALVE